MSGWTEVEFVLLALSVVIVGTVALVSLADPAPTTEQRERSSRAFADKLGLRVVGVSCEWIHCTIAYESGEGVRTLGATCGAESCAGDP
jgi:hypothetical protein